MTSRQDLPQYAEWGSIHLSANQFRTICKGRVPKWVEGNDVIRIAQTRDGKWWGEWRGSMVFWARRWYEIPRTVGERARRINEFVESL